MRFKGDTQTNPSQAISFSKDIIEADNKFLTKHVTDEEIFAIVKQMNPCKAPGPDGMRANFYQKCWNIVGKSVCNMVRSFFNPGPLIGHTLPCSQNG